MCAQSPSLCAHSFSHIVFADRPELTEAVEPVSSALGQKALSTLPNNPRFHRSLSLPLTPPPDTDPISAPSVRPAGLRPHLGPSSACRTQTPVRPPLGCRTQDPISVHLLRQACRAHMTARVAHLLTFLQSSGTRMVFPPNPGLCVSSPPDSP